eukprot:3885981-Rhodomonas_salina.2
MYRHPCCEQGQTVPRYPRYRYRYPGVPTRVFVDVVGADAVNHYAVEACTRVPGVPEKHSPRRGTRYPGIQQSVELIRPCHLTRWILGPSLDPLTVSPLPSF